MTYKYFPNPFAEAGDVTAIPDAVSLDGTVSYAQGFGPLYEGNLAIDPDALPIPREQFNQLMLSMTSVLQQYQQFSIPPFITTLQNLGTPFPYSKHAIVLYDDGSGVLPYQSLIDANTNLPTDTTAWAVFGQSTDSIWNTGDIKNTHNPVIPTGWILWANGTVGNAGSTATIRANADCFPLFSLYWTFNPTDCPVSGGRGATAAADFLALKTIGVPVTNGDTLVNASGSSYRIGQSFGAATVTLTSSQLPITPISYASGTGTMIPITYSGSSTITPELSFPTGTTGILYYDNLNYLAGGSAPFNLGSYIASTALPTIDSFTLPTINNIAISAANLPVINSIGSGGSFSIQPPSAGVFMIIKL